MLHSPNTETPRGSVHIAFSIAHLLEKIESSGDPVDAAQYQLVVSRLKAALSDRLPGVALTAVLRAYPSASEIYENMHYRVSGLSRSPLDRSISSELLAKQLLARVGAGARSGHPPR